MKRTKSDKFPRSTRTVQPYPVICVDVKPRVPQTESPGSYIREGAVYLVQGEATCSCGETMVDVGMAPDTGRVQCTCGCCWPDSRYWFMASRFRRIPQLIQFIVRTFHGLA